MKTYYDRIARESADVVHNEDLSEPGLNIGEGTLFRRCIGVERNSAN
jgi:hypothetical protein